jgi:hypothetical protein
MNELYIHIGMPKTATTALQRFFKANRERLKQKGIMYPVSEPMEAHHRLGWALKSEKGLAHWWFHNDIGGCDDEWKKLHEQCVLPRNLISTETLWGVSAEDVSRVRKLTRSFQVRIVMYLRRQDLFKESMYSEQVKGGIEKGTERQVGDPQRKFTLWERAFGKDSLIVRPFEREQFCQGSIFADFMKNVFDEPLTDDYVIPGSEVNSRLHRVALEYKRLVNHLPLPPNEQFAAIEPLRQAGALLEEDGRQTDFIFSPEKRLSVVEKCQPFYSRIAREYLGRSDGVLFYEPLPDRRADWRPYPELRPEDAVRINQFLASAHPEVLKMIAGGIANAGLQPDKAIRLAADRLRPGILPEWIVPRTEPFDGPPALNKTIGRATVLDDIYSSPLWGALKVFRPVYHRLPNGIREKSLMLVHRLCRFVNRRRPVLPASVSKSDRPLILHVGTVKTGTTALQKFFALNRGVLRARGIIYPENKNKAHAHHRISWCFVVRDGIPKPHWPKDIRRPQKEWDFLLRQITEGTGLISSEHLVRSRLSVIREIRQLTRDFKVKIVIYWRRRDGLEDSWYNQLTKGGDNCLRPSPREGLTSKKHLDMWAEVFGKENIIVRPYERSQLYKGDVLADFLHHIFGFEMDHGFILPEEEANTRLHPIVLEYKRLVNHLPLSKPERRKTTDPLRDLSAFLSAKGRKSYPVFSPAQRLELIDKYAEENAVIAREYLGRADGRMFYDSRPNPDEEWQPYENLLEDDARLINEYLAEHYPEVMEVIIRGLLAAASSGSGRRRQAAVRLLPGLPPDRIDRSLFSGTDLPDDGGEVSGGEDDELEGADPLRTWKKNRTLRRIYDRAPGFVTRPAMALVRSVCRFKKSATHNR